MKVLIIGMGFGNLYKNVHLERGHEVVTVDLNGTADYTDVDTAIREHGRFDMTHVCTPNYLHVKLARKAATHSAIVIVEKPGAATADAWQQLVRDYPQTRFMMSKNNMWRDNILDMQAAAQSSETIHINWLNRDRIPSPGSWFTTKQLAYGGVSRDLMPHLLSLYIALNPNWRSGKITYKNIGARHNLQSLTHSDYGTIDVNGTYDVDDYAVTAFDDRWFLTANWKSDHDDQRNIVCGTKSFELGLCPEYAYEHMILAAFTNQDNDDFWRTQYEYDMWIHSIIEQL